MNSFKVNAIVLRRRNFLEKDRILTLFSKEEGKIEGLAKGARRPGNRLSPNSDLGTIARFHLHKTKSIDIITEIDPIYHPFGARGEYEKTQTISYALKIIDRLFELGEAHPNTYISLCALVESISLSKRQLIFLKFIIEVLRDLGSLPEFDNCAFCQKKILASDDFVFDLKGGLAHHHCSGGECLLAEPEEIKLLRVVSSLSTEQVSSYKTNQAVFEKAYKIILEHFIYEFGKLLPDEVM